MNLLQATYLLSIQKNGSVTKAAAELFITQSALSKYLAQTEKKLGFSIFDRSRNMKPTYEGEVYLAFVRQFGYDYKQTMEKITKAAAGSAGRVIIGIPLNRGEMVLPEFLSLFFQRFPDIKVELEEAPAEQLKNMLLNDDVDAACMVPRLESDKLRYIPLAKEEVGILVQPELLREDLRDGEFLHMSQIAALPMIMLNSQFRIRMVTNMLFQRYAIIPDCVLETKNVNLVSELVSRGAGATITTRLRPWQPSRDHRLKFYAIEGEEISWELGIALHRSKYVNSCLHVFLSEFQKHIQRDHSGNFPHTLPELGGDEEIS